MKNRKDINMENDLDTASDSTENLNNKDDFLVKSIGAFGTWQATVCIIASLSRYTAVTNMFSILFLTPSSEFICVDFNITDPENSTCYENCARYEFYDNIFEETLTSEFELICDKMWMEGFTQSVLFFGYLVGVAMFGWISDRFGRRFAFNLSSFINILFMFSAPFAPNYWIFTILRWFVGLASGGVMIIGIVYVIETVGPKYREIAATLMLLPDGVAEASLSGIAYLSPGWRIYLLGYTLISVVIASLVPFLPETPRWLISKGKIEDAVIILKNAAKTNKLNIDHIDQNVNDSVEELKSIDADNAKYSYLDLFKSKNIAMKTICSILVWTSAALCYFGINQYITFLGTDIFISVLLIGFIQVPILPLAIIINKSFGRKTSIIGSFFAMTTIIFIEHGHWLCTIIALIGFAASCTIFGVLFVYVCELFPTPLRNMAYGLSSAGAKVGAMMAPYVALLSPQWIPSSVFAAVPMVGIIFCLALPETKGKRLRHAVE